MHINAYTMGSSCDCACCFSYRYDEEGRYVSPFPRYGAPEQLSDEEVAFNGALRKRAIDAL